MTNKRFIFAGIIVFTILRKTPTFAFLCLYLMRWEEQLAASPGSCRRKSA